MIGISQFTLNELDFYSSINLLRSEKFNKISLYYHSLLKEDLETVKIFLMKNNIKPINLAAAGISTQSYTAWVEDVLNAICMASELNIKDVVVIASPMGCDNIDTSLLHLKKGINEVLPVAKEKQIRILIEPLHPIMRSLSVLTNFNDGLTFVKDYHPEQVGLVLDLFHCWWDSTLESLIPEAIPYIGVVQISDWRGDLNTPLERNFIGDGMIPIRNYLNILNKSGYKGQFEIEIISDSWKADRQTMLQTIHEEIEFVEDYLYAK
ncbi:sugar phosphate isomerase/epimerase [Bacillus cereus]|uniref:sugar phosphate isomerase/epimerase family protein n=1 Tax=Bacillus cereus TaxID=1396 RepID=UPI0018F34A01|nr:sugar phosphate isomerase/epimerase family protein [Bacillus cereus]MBJ8055387.1 sugar phosphate isomerase/epimerase [Bacillus cereus]